MKNLFTLILFFVGLVSYSQSDDNPLKVTPSVQKISDTEYDLIFDILIAEDWHLYSQYNPDGASLPLTIAPAEGQTGYVLNGKATESETETEFSEIWGMDETFFVDEARLVQRVTIDDPSLTKITLNLDAQVCKEYCLPFDEDFSFSLTGEEVAQTVEEVDEKIVDEEERRSSRFMSSDFDGELLFDFLFLFMLFAAITPLARPTKRT